MDAGIQPDESSVTGAGVGIGIGIGVGVGVGMVSVKGNPLSTTSAGISGIPGSTASSTSGCNAHLNGFVMSCRCAN